MADVTRWGGAKVRHFCYANTNLPKTLVDPVSVSCYVYDPTNTMVYSNNQPLRDPAFPIGVFDFFIPAPIFLSPTVPEAYFTITTFAQMQDGSIQTTEELIKVA